MSRTAARSEIIDLFRDTFRSRSSVYAKGFPKNDGSDKYAYNPARDEHGNDIPLTDDIIWDHLKGTRFIGIYPLQEDNVCSWAALDFDGKDTDPFDAAFQQKEAFLQAGLFSYVERSRSGSGAHVWLFFDQPVAAFKVRRVIYALLIPQAKPRGFDMIIPNQDYASGKKYGTLIAFPYHGPTFKEHGNSCFLGEDRQPLHPLDFFSVLQKNSVEVVNRLFETLPPAEEHSSPGRAEPVRKLSGALKFCEFCNWFKQAKARMPQQNQEPELYSMACQLVQLEGGRRILDQVASLHPYSEERVTQKWEQAEEKNLPESCRTIRAKYGDCGKRCDAELDINHPYELARIAFNKLRKGEKSNPESYSEIAVRVVERAEQVARGEREVGIAYGWDSLDNHTELRGGDLVIVAGLVSRGKTAFAVDTSVNIASRGTVVFGSTIEMLNDRVGHRMLARRADIDATRIENGMLSAEEWEKITRCANDPLPIYVDEKAQSLEQILDYMGEMVHKYGKSTVPGFPKGVGWVDYLQIVEKESGENDREATARAVVGLKSVAKFLDIPLITFSQLGRGAEHDERDGEDPLDSWLAQSGMIERVADVIIYLRGPRTNKPIASRKMRIHKERNRGSAGIELPFQLHQAVYRFEPQYNNATDEGLF